MRVLVNLNLINVGKFDISWAFSAPSWLVPIYLEWSSIFTGWIKWLARFMVKFLVITMTSGIWSWLVCTLNWRLVKEVSTCSTEGPHMNNLLMKSVLFHFYLILLTLTSHFFRIISNYQEDSGAISAWVRVYKAATKFLDFGFGFLFFIFSFSFLILSDIPFFHSLIHSCMVFPLRINFARNQFNRKLLTIWLFARWRCHCLPEIHAAIYLIYSLDV